MNIASAVNEAIYWGVRRPCRRAAHMLIWRLPEPIVYWCVVRAACRVEPNTDPSGVTAGEMLDAFAKRTEGQWLGGRR